MSSSDSIGIFDSGFGGLTVMRAIRDALPHENIIYFGDTARLPYGNKSRETIRNYAHENSSFLATHQIKLLVIACHTACAYALDELSSTQSIPIVGVIPPSVQQLASLPKKKRIAILGTKATIASGVYQQKIAQILPTADIFAIPCPFFVPLVEEGYIDHPLTDLAAHEYLSSLKSEKLDAALLGCTHYPLLKSAIKKQLGSEIALIDPGIACAEEVQRRLQELSLLNPQKTPAHLRFFVSDDPEKFRLLGKNFLSQPIDSVTLK